MLAILTISSQIFKLHIILYHLILHIAVCIQGRQTRIHACALGSEWLLWSKYSVNLFIHIEIRGRWYFQSSDNIIQIKGIFRWLFHLKLQLTFISGVILSSYTYHRNYGPFWQQWVHLFCRTHSISVIYDKGMTSEMKVINRNFKWNNHRKIPLIWIISSDGWKYQSPLFSIWINKLA